MYLVVSGHSFPGARVLLLHLEVLSQAAITSEQYTKHIQPVWKFTVITRMVWKSSLPISEKVTQE